MKTSCTLLFLFIATALFSQHAIEGDWRGSLNVGMELRTVLHFKKDASGKYSCLMDSPDQGVKNIPLSDVGLNGDSLVVASEVIGGEFDGAFMNDTTVNGIWKQSGQTFPLTIVKTAIESKRNRPQTPKPPYTYVSEDVEYDNADKTVHFGATLTYPSAGTKFPTAILLTGSGQQDRDESIFEHKPFAVIADELTKHGFAVLRVDDRSMGKTTGMLKGVTSADFANDAEAGIAYLKTRKETDPSRIGLIGHSEGGYIAELLAGRRNDIDFIVLLGGPGGKGSELLADQNVAMLQSEGVPGETAKLYKPIFLEIMEAAIQNADTAIAFKKAWSDYEAWKKPLSKATLKQIGFTDEEGAKKVVHGLIEAASSQWMKYFLQSDGAGLLEKTTAKVLALNGEKDIQVLAKPNLAGIRAALAKSKSKVHEVKELPGLNHLFQHCNKCTIAEYAELEETFSPEALAVMSEWLVKNVKAHVQ